MHFYTKKIRDIIFFSKSEKKFQIFIFEHKTEFVVEFY